MLLPFMCDQHRVLIRLHRCAAGFDKAEPLLGFVLHGQFAFERSAQHHDAALALPAQQTHRAFTLKTVPPSSCRNYRKISGE